MKPHPRIRKTVKWGGLVVSAFLAAAWVGSTRVRIDYCEVGAVSFAIDNGAFYLYRIDAVNGRVIEGWQWGAGGPFSIQLLPYLSDDSRGWSVITPFWIPLVPATAMTAWAWRLDAQARRRASGPACPACGYALVGLPAGSPCPECGRANPTEPPAAAGDSAADSPQRHGDTEAAQRKPD